MIKLFKIINNYIIYKKLMVAKEGDFIKKFKLRKDWIGRYYTIVNLSFDKEYGMELVKQGLKKFTDDFNNMRFKSGLQDLIKIKSIKSVDAINYKAIIGYNNGIRINKVKLMTNIILLALGLGLAILIYNL